MTLLRQFQGLVERTYGSTGVNLEECLVGGGRYRELSRQSGTETSGMSAEGRTFFQIRHGRLHLAIYYDPGVIEILERYDPMRELGNRNIRAVVVFLEEIDHAIHGSLRFLENRFATEAESGESMLEDLELQARVDIYLVLELMISRMRRHRRLSQQQRQWLQSHLFRGENFQYSNPFLENRYRNANFWGNRLINHLGKMDSNVRVPFLRAFRSLGLEAKKAWIHRL